MDSNIKDWKREYENLEEEFNAILNSSSDGIHITDGKGVTLKFNKACERIDGVSREYMIGKNMKELVKEGIYSESVALAVIKDKKEISMLQNVNGKEVIGTGTPILKDGQLNRIVINSRDITELNNLKRNLKEEKLYSEKVKAELEILNKKENAKKNKLIYISKKIDKIVELSMRVAKVDSTILIEGESGVGKGVLVNFIHNNSLRKNKPFIKIDCGAIPENLLESELFGYEGGSFTGASKDGKIGVVQLADTGTLFLDEIGELPLNLQVKLLNVIQEKKITRIGGNKEIPVDIRIIVATNRKLINMVEKGEFREDLFYRLNVVPITIPPIRERKEDIPKLVYYFLNKFNDEYNFNKSISQDIMKKILQYDWPGNIREIENFVERLVVTVEGDKIQEKDLIYYKLPCNKNNSFDLENIKNFKSLVQEYEKDILEYVVKYFSSTKDMAEFLELDPSTIRKKCKNYNIKLNFS